MSKQLFIQVDADEILLMHDKLSDIVSHLDAIGNLDPSKVNDVVTDCITDLSLVLENNMFYEAGELMYPNHGWGDDEDEGTLNTEGIEDIEGVTHV